MDDVLIEQYRKAALEADGHPFIGSFDWARAILDLIRAMNELKEANRKLTEGLQRQVKS